ncbi:MAG: hypothetical protein WAU71_04140, partial [Pyrinomonadaceae bacterium]
MLLQQFQRPERPNCLLFAKKILECLGPRPGQGPRPKTLTRGSFLVVKDQLAHQRVQDSCKDSTTLHKSQSVLWHHIGLLSSDFASFAPLRDIFSRKGAKDAKEEEEE